MTVSRVWAATALLLAAAVSAIAGDIPLTTTEAVVVLRNGFVLRGRVTPLGDHYLVTMGDDDHVRVPLTRVRLICSDLEEAYLQQRDQCPTGDVRGHLRLAAWCLQHELRSRAADQILAVLALDPSHPELSHLENRLRGGDQRATSTTQALPSATAAAHEEIEGVTSQISPASLQHFTAVVQPLLMNRCGTNACHGPSAENDLRLLRPAFGRLLTRRITQRNLYTVLRQVDLDNPAQSPLVTVPAAPHGGEDVPVLGATETGQYETLLAWILQLPAAQDATPARIVKPEPLLQTRAERSSAKIDEQEAAVLDETSLNAADPFDPAIFNQRHSTQPPTNAVPGDTP